MAGHVDQVPVGHRLAQHLHSSYLRLLMKGPWGILWQILRIRFQWDTALLSTCTAATFGC